MPAFAIGYRMPERNSHDAIVAAPWSASCSTTAMRRCSISNWSRKTVTRFRLTGGVNWPLGNPFEFNGPTLMTTFIVSPPGTKMDAVLKSVDKVVGHLAQDGPSAADLARVVTKMRSDFIDQMEAPIDRASLLAHATLFDGNPDRVNKIPAELAAVTSRGGKEFRCKKYLVAKNRTVIERDPAATPAAREESGRCAMRFSEFFLPFCSAGNVIRPADASCRRTPERHAASRIVEASDFSRCRGAQLGNGMRSGWCSVRICPK